MTKKKRAWFVSRAHCRSTHRWLTGGLIAIVQHEDELKLFYRFSDIKLHSDRKPSKVAQVIEEGVKTVRQEVSKVTDVYESSKAQIDRYYVDAMKETQRKLCNYQSMFLSSIFLSADIRNYLQEEDNTMPRVGAIAVGSLAGVVLGVRGGFFKKLFYASITGSAVASVCYPRDARKYAQVVYNFAYGIKPGDERQKDLPKFPTTFGEFTDNVASLSSRAYEAAFGKKW